MHVKEAHLYAVRIPGASASSQGLLAAGKLATLKVSRTRGNGTDLEMLALRLTQTLLPWRKGLGRGAWVGDSNSLRQRVRRSVSCPGPTPQALWVAARVTLAAK